MEKIDPAMEQRVWGRVRGDGVPAQPGLQALAAAELAEAAVFLMLSRQLQGREKEQLRRLFAEEQRHADRLRGMHTMITGQPLPLRMPPAQTQLPETALRKSYAHKLRAIGEYQRRSEDREYGAVFAELARQEMEQCAVILEIMGNLKR